MKTLLLAGSLLTGVGLFATGTISTQRADGTFEAIQSDEIVNGCIVTLYLDGEKMESFDGGKIVNTYYSNGNKKTSYNFNHGNEKFYTFDKITGQRTEPKYQTANR